MFRSVPIALSKYSKPYVHFISPFEDCTKNTTNIKYNIAEKIVTILQMKIDFFILRSSTLTSISSLPL